MNFAFGTIVILLMLTPGIAFRVSFAKSDTLKSNIDASLAGELMFFLLPAITLHAVATSLLWKFHAHIDLYQIYMLIAGGKNEPEFHFSFIQNGLNYFFIYIVVLCITATALGKALQLLVLRFDLDKTFYFLKVSNEWDILFSGRELDRKLRKNLQFVQIDAVVESKEGDMLFCGFLKKYTLSKTQGLDKIYLVSVVRRLLKEDNKIEESELRKAAENGGNPRSSSGTLLDKKFDSRYYAMPGNYLIIPYSAIKNINVTYLFAEYQ